MWSNRFIYIDDASRKCTYIAFGITRISEYSTFRIYGSRLLNRLINYEAASVSSDISTRFTLWPAAWAYRQWLVPTEWTINSSSCESRECFITRDPLRRGRDTDSLFSFSFPREPSVRIIVITPPPNRSLSLNDNASIRYFASGCGIYVRANVIYSCELCVCVFSGVRQ